MKAIDRLRNHPRVLRVEDERNIGNGVIVTLRAGWHFDPLDVENRVIGEDTPTAALEAVRQAYKAPEGTVLTPDEEPDPLPAPAI